MRLSFLVLGCLAIASACTKLQTCKAGCEGCCDLKGECLAGTTDGACGQAGDLCGQCATPTRCFERSCQLDPSLDGGDAGATPDAGSDAGSTPDAGSDAGSTPDAGPDAGSTPDAGPDAGSAADAGVDAGSGPAQYPDGGGLHRYWDGGTCTVKTDCPCFSSDDCGPGFTCHSEDSTGLNVFCVPGARGAGLVGASCTGEADCLSALCTDSTSAGQRCSALCELSAECTAPLPRCLNIGFGVDRSICAP